jgi:hypothetical protein
MSTSLARKLRRIGLTRTFTEVPITVIVKDEQGVEIEQTATRTITNRHRIQYSPEELKARQTEIVTAWRARRKRARAMKAGRS